MHSAAEVLDPSGFAVAHFANDDAVGESNLGEDLFGAFERISMPAKPEASSVWYKPFMNRVWNEDQTSFPPLAL
jgi:hypothetical protein